MVIALKPVIGMTAMFSDANGSRVYKINDTYVQAILDAGGIPMILPSCKNIEEYVQFADCLDGYLVPGGADVAPLLYGEEAKRPVVSVRRADDEFEFAMIRKMAEQNKPILGICRGCQVINVAFGGNLIQDIPSMLPDSNSHYQTAPRHEAFHNVDLVEGSRLADIFGCTNLQINSFHHQAVRNAAPGFNVVGHARDGVIEAIEHESKYIIGVQWHPEGMYTVHEVFGNLFKDFVAAAAK